MEGIVRSARDVDGEPWITVCVVYGEREVDLFKVRVRDADPGNLMGLAP